jgi:hypothetical protein
MKINKGLVNHFTFKNFNLKSYLTKCDEAGLKTMESSPYVLDLLAGDTTINDK